MLVDDILQQAGFVKNKTYRQTRFLKAPAADAYCTYSDSTSRIGSDARPYAVYHSVSIEYYELAPDDEKAAALEASLDAHWAEMATDENGSGWQKMERYWIDTGQLYQTVYMFDYIDKL